MIDSRKAVFLPIDSRILNLYRGYILDGKEMPDLKESDIYTNREYYDYEDKKNIIEIILKILILILFLPLIILGLIISFLFQKLKVFEKAIDIFFNQFDRLFRFSFKEKKIAKKRVVKTLKEQYNEINYEDILGFLKHCQNSLTQVFIYTYSEISSDEESKLKNLIDIGLIDSVIEITKISDIAPIIISNNISLINSVMVIKRAEDARLLAFNFGGNYFKNITLWKTKNFESEDTSSQVVSNSRETLISIKKDIEHYLIAKNKSFFLPNCILYIEDEYNPLANNYIQNNYKNINRRLSKKGMHLIYFPCQIPKQPLISDSLFQFLRYKYPVMYSLSDAEMKSIINFLFDKLTPQEFYKFLLEELQIPYFPRPALLKNIMAKHNETGNKFTYASLTDKKTKRELDLFFKSYFKKIQIVEDDGDPALDKMDKLLDGLPKLGNPGEDDADWNFSWEAKKLSNELKIKIDGIKADGEYEILAKALMYLLETIKEDRPEIINKVRPAIERKKLLESAVVLSPIQIDAHFKILLPEFGNIEVRMHALPKTVYLLFLRYPEGIRFKELYEYKKELLEIYNRITSIDDNEEIKQKIDDLVDMRKKSLNEKCSRIREAFRNIMDEHIAKYYYIDGLNGEPKKIALPAHLVDIRY